MVPNEDVQVTESDAGMTDVVIAITDGQMSDTCTIRVVLTTRPRLGILETSQIHPSHHTLYMPKGGSTVGEYWVEDSDLSPTEFRHELLNTSNPNLPLDNFKVTSVLRDRSVRFLLHVEPHVAFQGESDITVKFTDYVGLRTTFRLDDPYVQAVLSGHLTASDLGARASEEAYATYLWFSDSTHSMARTTLVDGLEDWILSCLVSVQFAFRVVVTSPPSIAALPPIIIAQGYSSGCQEIEVSASFNAMCFQSKPRLCVAFGSRHCPRAVILGSD